MTIDRAQYHLRRFVARHTNVALLLWLLIALQIVGGIIAAVTPLGWGEALLTAFGSCLAMGVAVWGFDSFSDSLGPIIDPFEREHEE